MIRTRRTIAALIQPLIGGIVLEQPLNTADNEAIDDTSHLGIAI